MQGIGSGPDVMSYPPHSAPPTARDIRPSVADTAGARQGERMRQATVLRVQNFGSYREDSGHSAGLTDCCNKLANLRLAHLNRRLSRESWLIAVQPISFMSRSSSVCIRPIARSTPACPAAAKG